MNKIYVIYWEEKYSNGSFKAGVLPFYYTSFTKAYLAMHESWATDMEELRNNGMSQENIHNLTITKDDSITFDNYDEWIKYDIRELEME